MTAQERFWAKVDRRGPNECWPWLGSRIPKDGRGIFWNGERQESAPRAAFRIATGQAAPADKLVCHTCDNPPCVNPAHLWLGTARDNTLDAKAKGRLHQMTKTHCVHGHPFSGDNVYLDRMGCRQCRICTLERVARNNRKYRAKKLALRIERGEHRKAC